MTVNLSIESATGEVLNKIFDFTEKANKARVAANNSSKSSLIKFTSVSRVEPLCIVDTDCVHLDYISDVLNTLQSIFSGYYLQAVSLIGTVNGVQVAKELDKLNPNRDPQVSDFINSTRDTFEIPYRLSRESYRWTLPTKKNKVSVESVSSDFYSKSYRDQKEELKGIADDDEQRQNKGVPVVSEKEFLSVNEMANLSVGKLLNVTISKNGQNISVPISIRLLVNELRPSTIVKMFGNGAMEKSFKERYYKWKSGRISFFNDLILCKDLIKEQKKALMEDKDGVATEILSRANKNTLSGLFTRQPSMATASNLYVISEATAAAIKRSSGLDINNFNQRQELFDETYAMILVVIDRDYQRINFYHDGIRLPTSVGLRDIRGASKDSGPSILDILNAYKQGQTPTL